MQAGLGAGEDNGEAVHTYLYGRCMDPPLEQVLRELQSTLTKESWAGSREIVPSPMDMQRLELLLLQQQDLRWNAAGPLLSSTVTPMI